jgi:hypothetical protein
MVNLTSITHRPQSAAVIVSYDGVDIVPGPLISMTVEPQFNDVGVRQSTKTRITLANSIVILPSGSYEQLFVYQQDLRTVFANDYKDLVIRAGPANRTLPVGTIISSGLRPKVVSVDIPADLHVLRFEYNIELEDSTAASGVSGVTSSFSNQWSFRENPDSCTLDVTHTVSADGIQGEPDAFENAMRAVQAVLGIQNLPLSLPSFAQPNASGGFGFTHPSNPIGGPIFEVSVQREETADVANGSYSVTEVFTIVSGVPFYFTRRNSSYQEDQNGVTNVTVDGTVQGLGRTLAPGDPEGSVGFQRALSGFINHVRPNLRWEASGIYVRHHAAPFASGLIFNNPTSYSVAENKCRGTIDFSITYSDNLAINLPSGIAESQSSIQRVDGIELIVSHVIPLRRIGNLLQSINTTTEGTVTISASARAENTGDPKADTNRAIDYVEYELNRLRSIHAREADFITLRVSGLEQGVNDRELTSNASISYTFTIPLESAQSVDSLVSLRRI